MLLFRSLAALVLGMALVPSVSHAQNLLQNGGFESSSFTTTAAQNAGSGLVRTNNPATDEASIPNWTWTADPTASGFPPYQSNFILSRAGTGETNTVVDGTLAVVFGAGSYSGGGSIKQNFTPNAGTLYIVNLSAMRIGAGENIGGLVTITDNVTNATVATKTIDMSTVGSQQWRQFTFTFTAPSNNLSFTFADTTANGAAGSTDLGLDAISIQAASTQTLTILGGYGSAGSFANNTEFSVDNGATWHQAYLAGQHPWGNIAGTNIWINQAPNLTTGLYLTTLFRIKFTAPAIMASPGMTFSINADNIGAMTINGHTLQTTVGGPPPYPFYNLGAQYIVPGENILTIALTDQGGLVGLNYRIDLTAIASQPITVVQLPPVIVAPSPINGQVGSAFGYQVNASNNPTTYSASGLPANLSMNGANGFISGTPAIAGSFSVGLAASNNAGTGSASTVLAIARGPGSFTFSNLARTYTGSALSPTVATNPSNLGFSLSYSGPTSTPTAVGSYPFIATITDPNYSGTASNTFTITQAPATVTLSNLAQGYDGNPKPVTVTTVPASLGTSVTYNASTTAPSGVGSYPIVATVTDSNYTGSAIGTLTISDVTKPVLSLPANITVEATGPSGAVVTFAATANDDVSGSVPVTLSPASGSVFPIGLTTVNASAADAAGNIATGSFTVDVHALTITVDKPTVTVNEGTTATNSGAFNDSDALAVTVSTSKGAASQTASGTWTYQQTLNLGGHPIELSLDSQDNVYIANENNTVYKYDSAGNFVTSWTVAGTPKGIAVDRVNNFVYVVANAAATVQKYTLTGTFVSSLGSPGSGDGQLSVPHCVDVDASGNVYVSDTGNSRIEVFASNGTYLRQWGTAGSADGQFNFNQGIRITKGGQVYVADRNNNRIQFFDLNGNFLGKWGSGGSGDGQFSSPASVGIDPSGNIYVGDIANNRVQKFTATGTFVDKFGPGSGAGALNLPHGTVFPQAGRTIYVASWGSGVVQKYTTPGTWNWSYNVPLGAVGSSVVTATATNTNGIVTATTFNLVVLDVTPPALTVPGNITLEATSAAGAVATFTATATDAVTASPTITYSKASGSMFPLGTTPVIVTASDAAGNIATNTFTVTVRDTTAPVIVPIANLTAEATSAAGAVVTFSTSASDIVSGNVAVSSSPASGSTFPLGITTVTLSASDAAGNTATTNFTVTIQDTTPPVLTLPTSPIIAEATSPAGAPVSFTTSATDTVSGNVLVTTSAASGSTFPLGDSVVTASAQDSAGNVQTSSFTITVRDTTAPVISIAPTQAALFSETFDGYTNGIQSALQYLSNLKVSYNGDLPGWTKGGFHALHAVNLNGASNYAIMIYNDNTITSTQDVAANDLGTAYVVKFSAGPAVYATPSQSTTATDGLVVELLRTDGTVAFSFTYKPGAYAGSSTLSPVIFNYTGDGSGAVHARVRSLLLQDTFAGVIENLMVAKASTTVTAPADITVEATSAAGAIVNFNAVANDLVSLSVPVTASTPSGSTFPLGPTTVTLNAVDAAGNLATATFVVRIVDTTKPVLTLPSDLTSEATSAAGAVVTFSASANDLVSGSCPVSLTPVSGSVFPLGTTTVKAVTTDAAGNAATGSFNVTVRDTTKPVLTLPTNLTVEATGSTGAIATFSASATDIVSGSVPVTLTPASGSMFPLGTTAVNASSTDAANNTATGSFSVTVQDTTPPTLSLPANQTLEATSPAGAIATFTVTGSDAVSAVTTATSVPSGTTFALGTTTVTATGTDAAGNVQTGSFTITVKDTTPPVITQANLVTEATSPQGAVVNFAPTAADIVSGTVTVSSSVASGSTFAVGTTPITLTAIDAAGNVGTLVFSVTVTDTTAPVIAPQDNLTVEATSAAGAVVTFTPSAFDIVSGAVSVNSTPASGSTFALGVTTVTLTAKDAAGNSASATFTVTVVDTTPPVIATPANIVAEATSAAGAVITFNASAKDVVSGAVAVAASPVSGSVFPIGTTTVSLTSHDAAGNASSSTFKVTVRDTTAPVIGSVANQTLEATGPTGAIASYVVTATDAVGATVSYAPAPGSVFALGTTSVTVTAQDAAGNTSTKTFTITVRDTTSPALSLPANQTLEATGPTGATATFSASANDIVSGNVPVSFTANSGSTFAIGTTLVTATAVDAAHNVATGTFTITVRDTTPPVLTVPANQTLEATSAAGAVATFTATATDAVGATITYSKASGSTFALGTTTVTVTAKDAAGNATTKTFTITVRDTTPPTITSLIANPAVLWPPNHKMVAVTITAVVTDLVDPAPVTKIVSVTSNEPVQKGNGDDNRGPAWQITGPLTLNLRAERLGEDMNRIYTITVQSTDASGNVSTKTVTVTVAKDHDNQGDDHKDRGDDHEKSRGE